LTQYDEQIKFVNEILQWRLESRPVSYDMNEDSWILMEEYSRNHSYYMVHGNETTNKIGCTKMLQEII
jgi:hypothetical protein